MKNKPIGVTYGEDEFTSSFTGTDPKSLRVMHPVNVSWTLALSNLRTMKRYSRETNMADDVLTPTEENLNIKPTVQHIVAYKNVFHIGGYVKTGAVLGQVKDDFSDPVNLKLITALDLGFTTETGLIVQNLQVCNDVVIALFALTKQSKPDEYQRFSQPYVVLARIMTVGHDTAYKRQIHVVKLKFTNSTISSQYWHQVLPLLFTEKGNMLRITYYRTTQEGKDLKTSQKGLQVNRNKQSGSKFFNNQKEDWSSMIQHFFIKTKLTISDDDYATDNDQIASSIQQSQDEYFHQNSGEGQMPVRDAKWVSAMASPTLSSTATYFVTLHSSSNEYPVVQMATGVEAYTQVGELQGQSGKTKLKFRAYNVGLEYAVLVPQTQGTTAGTPYKAVEDMDPIADCSTATYTATPKNEFADGSIYASQMFKTQTSGNEPIPQIKAHATFSCTSNTAICNKCPLFIEWYWTNKTDQVPGLMEAIDLDKNVKMRISPIRRQYVVGGIFGPRKLDVPMEYVYQIRPIVRWTVMMKYVADMTKQTIAAPYLRVYNTGVAMNYPACIGYCSYQCSVSQESCAGGQFVQNQTYRFLETKVQNTKCFSYVGSQSTCLCTAGTDLDDQTFKDNFKELKACPTFVDSGTDNTIKMTVEQPLNFNWTFDKQEVDVLKNLDHVVKWTNAQFEVNTQTVTLNDGSAVTKPVFKFKHDTNLVTNKKDYKLQVQTLEYQDYTAYKVFVTNTLYTKLMSTPCAQSNLPKAVEFRYPTANYTIKIRIEDCKAQMTTATKGIKYLTVLYSANAGPIEILTGVDVKALFTYSDIAKCPTPFYDITDGKGKDPDNTMKERYLIDARTKSKQFNVNVDVTKFINLLDQATEDKFNVTFQIKANHLKTQGTYPSASKEINLEINFYDCTGKVINTDALTKNFEFYTIAKEPTEKIDFSKWFTPADKRCVVKTTKLYASADGKEELSKETLKIFKVNGQNLEVDKSLKNKGKYVIYIISKTRTIDMASIKLSFNLLPCLEGVGTVTAPTAFDSSNFYTSGDSFTKTGVIFTIGKDRVKDDEISAQKVKLQIPKFVNSEDKHCPLTYSLSSNSKKVEAVKGLILEKIDADTKYLEITVPLAYVTSTTFSIYVYADNLHGVSTFSSLLKVIQMPVCQSLLAIINKDKEISKTYSQVNYIHLIDSLDMPLESVLLKTFIDATKIDKIKDNECPLVLTKVTDIVVIGNDTTKVDGTASAADQFAWTLGKYIKLDFQSKKMDASKFSLDVSNLETLGFQYKTKITFKDINDFTETFTFEFNLCGKDFYDDTVCTVPEPVVEEEEGPAVNMKPLLESNYPDGVEVPDLFADYLADPAASSLKLNFNVGKAVDPLKEVVTVTKDVPRDYASIIDVTIADQAITMDIDMSAFYASSLMPDFEQPVKIDITITMDDGTHQVEKTVTVSFKGKPKPEEVKKEKVKVKEVVFKIKVPKIKAANIPVAVAPAAVPKITRKSPQIASVMVSSTGVCTFVFSKAIRYPANWIQKHMKDNSIKEMDSLLVDVIQAPFIEFLYEQAGQETPYKQEFIPQKDVKIESLTDTSISFKISFNILEDPESVSLTSSTEQDKLIVQISKNLIINDQEGESSLVLDKADFEEEDGENFFSSASLQTLKPTPKSRGSENVAAAAASGPAVTGGVTGGGMLVSMMSGTPPTEVSEDLKAEQDSAAESAQKTTAPGQVNSYNQEMSKSAGCDYKQVDFLAARKMVWTNQPPEGNELKCMGVTSKNFPKNMGSVLIGGAGAMVCANAAAPAVEALASALPFEGGTSETLSLAAQVKLMKKKYNASLKSPKTPIINALIGMIFLKILLGGIVNCQNGYLIEWNNFGPNGYLSVGDQISVIVGYGGLLLAFIIFIMLGVNLVSNVPWMFNFGKKVVGTENILRRKTNHKWFLFTMGQFKTFVTIYIIIFYSSANMAVPQLMLTLILNPANLFFAFNLKPLPMFYCVNLNSVVKFGDIAATIIVYMKISMTDVNRDPTVLFKLDIGWVILIVGQLKFYLGKFKLGSTQWLLHKKKIDALKSLVCPCLNIRKTKIVLSKNQLFFEQNRRQIIDAYKIRYKEKYYKLEKQPFEPMYFNKVAPLEAFKPLRKKKDQNANMYHNKIELKKGFKEKFKPGKVSQTRNVKEKLEIRAIKLEQINESINEQISQQSEMSDMSQLGIGYQIQKTPIKTIGRQFKKPQLSVDYNQTIDQFSVKTPMKTVRKQFKQQEQPQSLNKDLTIAYQPDDLEKQIKLKLNKAIKEMILSPKKIMKKQPSNQFLNISSIQR